MLDISKAFYNYFVKISNPLIINGLRKACKLPLADAGPYCLYRGPSVYTEALLGFVGFRDNPL